MVAKVHNLNQYIEHTALGVDLNEKKITEHIKEAIDLKVYGVCLPLAFIGLAKEKIKNHPLKLITVIDFPKGEQSPKIKASEALAAKTFGADEIDMVIDYKAIKDRNYLLALDGIKEVVKQAHPLIVKVIVETSALSKHQIAIACALVSLGNAHFIKTSTGFHELGAQKEDILLMRSLLPDHIQIKASGGIKTKGYAIEMINAGATRIGTSRTKEILLDIKQKDEHANY